MKGWTYDTDTGRIINFEDTANVIQMIKDNLEYRDDRIAEVLEENKRLKTGCWKDETLAILQNEIKTLRANARYGFDVTEDEFRRTEEWREQHRITYHTNASTGAIGGSFVYEFVPTSIGTIGTCVCSICRDLNKPVEISEFTFCELS